MAAVITEREFRQVVKVKWPHVKVSIRTVHFSDLARMSAQFLTVTGHKPGELGQINGLAQKAGIIPHE